MSYKSVPQECPRRVSHKSVPQERPIRVSHKSVLQECPTRVSYKSVPQECPTRVSYKSVPQESPIRVSHKSVLQECATRVSYKSDPQGCPTRVSYKSVPEECPTRVSYKSDPQECPTRVSYKSVPEECPTRVSYKSVIWTYVVFRTCLHSGSWVPFCLELFLTPSVGIPLILMKRHASTSVNTAAVSRLQGCQHDSSSSQSNRGSSWRRSSERSERGTETQLSYDHPPPRKMVFVWIVIIPYTFLQKLGCGGTSVTSLPDRHHIRCGSWTGPCVGCRHCRHRSNQCRVMVGLSIA